MGVEQYGSDKGFAHYIVKIEEDTGTANVFYIGHARPRTTAAQAGWRIKKIILAGAGTAAAGDTSIAVTWASGDDRFDRVWDDRQSYSYS